GTGGWNAATPTRLRHREAQTIGSGLSRVAAATRIGGIYHPAVTAGGGPVVGQTVANNLPGGRDFRIKDQRRAAGDVEVAVAVHPSAKTKPRAGKITQVAIGKNAELEYRDQCHFHVAEHVDVRTAWAGGVHLQGVKNLFCRQPGVRSGADRAPSCHRSEEHTSELQSRENLVCR